MCRKNNSEYSHTSRRVSHIILGNTVRNMSDDGNEWGMLLWLTTTTMFVNFLLTICSIKEMPIFNIKLQIFDIGVCIYLDVCRTRFLLHIYKYIYGYVRICVCLLVCSFVCCLFVIDIRKLSLNTIAILHTYLHTLYFGAGLILCSAYTFNNQS